MPDKSPTKEMEVEDQSIAEEVRGEQEGSEWGLWWQVYGYWMFQR